MKKITEITKRDITGLFRDGLHEQLPWDTESTIVNYCYHGRLSEIEFLGKLYQLERMHSTDSRFDNAKDDIWQHTVNNDDYPNCWVFEDDRFELLKGSDIVLLRFLCEIFHPENRGETGYWKKFLCRINELIRQDGYELYIHEKISGRSVYHWRPLTAEEISYGKFLPFSLRHKQDLDRKRIVLPSISRKVRTEILDMFHRYGEVQRKTTDADWNQDIYSVDAILEDLEAYYTPKAFGAEKLYVATNDVKEFVMNNHPYSVFDAIEIFFTFNSDNSFTHDMNLLFRNKGINYMLLDGKIEVNQTGIYTPELIKEVGVKELIEQATTLQFGKAILDKQLAIEKLWDAFERLKTYYTKLNKKTSAEKIIEDSANGNNAIKDLITKEFKELTEIGNKFRIRHHEMDKTEITETNHLDYIFARCLALINLVSKYLYDSSTDK